MRDFASKHHSDVSEPASAGGKKCPGRLKERGFGRKIIEDLPPKGAGEENMNAVLHLVNYAVRPFLNSDS